MEVKIRFFKQDNKWYADIPNHTLEENEMVMGADVVLDVLSNGKEVVFIVVTDEYPGWNTPLVFYRREHDEEGAFYDVDGVLLANFLNILGITKPEIWICNVTHDIFGEHPEKIYLLSIENF